MDTVPRLLFGTAAAVVFGMWLGWLMAVAPPNPHPPPQRRSWSLLDPFPWLLRPPSHPHQRMPDAPNGGDWHGKQAGRRTNSPPSTM
jgi:hypothetical protein